MFSSEVQAKIDRVKSIPNFINDSNLLIVFLIFILNFEIITNNEYIHCTPNWGPDPSWGGGWKLLQKCVKKTNSLLNNEGKIVIQEKSFAWGSQNFVFLDGLHPPPPPPPSNWELLAPSLMLCSINV